MPKLITHYWTTKHSNKQIEMTGIFYDQASFEMNKRSWLLNPSVIRVDQGETKEISVEEYAEILRSC